MAKIKSKTVRRSGKIERTNELERSASHVQQCIQRWESRQNELKDKPWGQCPEEIVADFVRSVARDVLAEYGPSYAASQMAVAAAVGKYKVSPEGMDMMLSCSVPEKDCGIEMRLTTVPEGVEDEGQPEVEFALAVKQDELEALDKKSVKDIALSLLNNLEGPEPREIFDPLADGSVPDSEILRLVQTIEKELPAGANNADSHELDVLMTAGTVLLTWHQAELRNAETVKLSLGGLTNCGNDVYPGMEVKVSSKIKIYDRKISRSLDERIELELGFYNKRKSTP